MNWFNSISLRTSILLGILLLAVFALILLFMGQLPICRCGIVKFWHGVTVSPENSQHITDWYTFSHIIHGLVFYWIFWRIGRRWNWPIGLRFLLALVAEISWEIFENTDFIINRYREVTISRDYFGDSMINAVGDVLSMALGFFLAYRLPVGVSVALIIIMELFVGYWIRDNLTLNIIMLIYPFQAILDWQASG